MSGMTEPMSEPGWYRILSWEHVTPEQAEAEIEDGRGRDLILVRSAAERVYQSSEAT